MMVYKHFNFLKEHFMQFLFLRTIKSHVTILLSAMLLFTTGCEDDDHDDHDHDDGHTDAEGFVLETEGGTILYRQFEGDVTTSNVTLAVGDTLELLVHFLDHDGAEIEHDDDEHETEESELQVTITAGSTFAAVGVEEHDDHGHDGEHHEMALEIIGLLEGTTSFSLSLMHGDHADFESAVDVPVTVTSGS